MGDSGERSTEGVVGENLTYDGMTFSGNFSFSLVTKIRDPVRNVTGLIVFYDIQGNPLDVVTFKCNEIIPGGLAKRVGFYMTHSVVKLNNPKLTSEYAPTSPSTQYPKQD